MFVSCMAGRHQWVTVGKYRLYSPLGSQRIKKRNYEEYKKYKKEDERGRLCCIDPAEQSRDALGTLLAGTVVFLENMSGENQIPGIPSFNLLGPPDWRCKRVGENAERSVTATLKSGTWAAAQKA